MCMYMFQYNSEMPGAIFTKLGTHNLQSGKEYCGGKTPLGVQVRRGIM